MSFKTSPPAFVVAGLRKLAAGGIMSRQLRDLYRDAADIIERQAANHARLGDNYENAWAALRLVREAIETLGPVGALCSEEGTLIERGPEPVHEAETLVRGIRAMADAARTPPATIEESSKVGEPVTLSPKVMAALKRARDIASGAERDGDYYRVHRKTLDRLRGALSVVSPEIRALLESDNG